ncbi:hypothetical protein LY01_02762 [Nonlabens xylanidelens]|uniref:Uncharacterized protein n=1 Tax=Nonlabens xylanidelens TaxID=191564 RepID=A0A2S6IFT7_9FLAO|nr:hypothetical protein [Nonlabens xylanidelens]PPK93057.1 hypothetical protein LY01_02762 [Nonlabens xylanidelens]PQJ18738.1 hypothetical protein BST94_06890 [Nonlabens xylanidelens]
MTIPISSNLPEIEHNLAKKAELLIALTSSLNSGENKFTTYLKSQFQLEKLSKKLQNWHELDFADFIKELNKAIKATNRAATKAAVIDLGDPSGQKETTPYQVIPELTKKDEYEWMELFEEKKKEVQQLQSQINQTEKEIDQMVYELYGLSDEEIKIVENS